ncbi:helix-turn-helix domain-containing protein [Sinobaca sp. H24]|uniref:helix-turn-helix domain-containing protein n=1 Tax=Sinobaca sp. H24 TaxID=2923376 RepID=UPI00207B0B74|nr:helix-turn-helix transcriptional regulator [Sinobaca sp. H24]
MIGIGNRIHHYRKKNQLTITALAERSGLSRSYLSNLEKNKVVNPSINVLNKIAEVLSVDVLHLLHEEARNECTSE